jgi:5-formyltetrahydrofolate cyclo-ligase
MNAQDLLAFRRTLRAALIEKRLPIGSSDRALPDTRIAKTLSSGAAGLQQLVIGFCWPYKGEFDLRPLAAEWCGAGISVTLCALAEVGAPMRFRRWSPAVDLVPGAYGISIPAGGEILLPDMLFIPLVGFDSQGYRLGYGGGYFDRFLTELQPKAITIGVSYAALRVATVQPQPHDVAMDFIVTDSALFAVTDRSLEEISVSDFASRCRALAAARGLPRRQSRGEPGSQLSSPVCYASEFPGHFGEASDDD